LNGSLPARQRSELVTPVPSLYINNKETKRITWGKKDETGCDEIGDFFKVILMGR
jgi:hypothetical protein